jgi:hypothetical protein
MTASYATYCIIDSDGGVPEGIAGLHGGVVWNLPYRGIGVAVSLLAGPVQDLVAGAVQHEAVVERLMRIHTVLPMRFPTVFASEDAIVAMMSRHYDGFCENLRRLCHQVEFGVRVLWPSAPGPAVLPRAQMSHESSGTQYLRERYRQYQFRKVQVEAADQFGRKLDAALSELVTAKRLRKTAADAFAFDGVYLVNKDKGAAFRQAFAEVRSREPNFEYLLSGPWPPYSFVAG